MVGAPAIVIRVQRATKHGVEPLLDARNLHRLPSRAIRRPLIKEQPATSSAKGQGRRWRILAPPCRLLLNCGSCSTARTFRAGSKDKMLHSREVSPQNLAMW